MKGRIRLITLLFCLLVPTVLVGAAGSIGSQLVYPAAAPLSLDGFAGDWGVGGLEPTLRVDPSFSLVNAGAIGSANESSADVYFLYDNDFVYVVAKVTDDNVTGNARDQSIWSNAGVELWISLSGSPANPADYGNYTTQDYQINLAPYTTGRLAPQSWVYPDINASHNQANPIEVAASVWSQGDQKGYLIEARIPKAKFPGMEKVTKGNTFQLAVSLVHIDKTGAWEHIWTPGVEYVKATVQ